MLNISDSNKYQAIQKGDKPKKLIAFKKNIILVFYFNLPPQNPSPHHI